MSVIDLKVPLGRQRVKWQLLSEIFDLRATQNQSLNPVPHVG
jgi:hypothetical protein